MSSKTLTRRVFLKSAGALAAVSLAACTPAVVEKEVIKEVTVVVPGEAKARQVILRLGKFAGKAWDFDEIWSKKFMEANPNIRVEIEDVIYGEMFKKGLALGATGTMWDVFAGHNIWAPYLAWKGLSLQLDDFVTANAERIDYEDFFPSVIADARYMGTSGNLYWFPTVVHPGGNGIVGFNVDMLNEAGVDVPCDPKEGDWTIMDWEEIVRKVAVPNETFGLRMDGELHPLYTQQYTRTWGAHMEDGSASTDSWILSPDGRKLQMYPDTPRVQAALEWYHKLTMDGYVPTTAQEASLPGVDLFAAGKLLSRGATVGAPEALRDRIGDKFEPIWVPWPMGPDGHRGSCLSYNTMSVYSKTQNVDESLELCNALSDKEPALYAGTEGTLHCMARKSAWFSDALWSRPNSGQVMEFAAHWFESGIDPFPQPYNLRFVEWEYTWRQEAQAYFDGKEDWDEFAPHTQDACQAVMDLDRP